MSTYNWDQMATDHGFTWVSEPVSKVISKNHSDKRIIGDAEILVMTDVEKFSEHFGAGVILGIANGTSIRVQAQDVCRRAMDGASVKPSVDQLREAVYNRVRGVKNSGMGRTVTIEKIIKQYILPSGQPWSGDNEVEYQQAVVEAFVELGLHVPSAIAAAANYKL